MEIKIDLDMDRIDYNAINAKILEKINDNFVEETMRRFYLKDDDIKELIQNRVLSAANEYIDRGYYYSNSPSETARRVAKEELKRRLNEEIDKILNEIGEDTLRKIIIETIPEAVLYTLCEDINKNIYERLSGYADGIMNSMRSEIYEKMSQKGILL